MKKSILTIVGLLFLLLIPLNANAATISADKTEMKVKDTVTVTVNLDTTDVEAIQFDLKFDNTKYKYVLNSAKSELDSTESNVIGDNNDIVRVSAFNFDENKLAQSVTLEFEATNSGTSVPFNIVGGTLEAVNKNNVITTEAFAEPAVKINKIEKIKTDDSNGDKEYINDQGQKITNHAPTGSNDTTSQSVKSIAGVYSTLIPNTFVVPYALETSDTILTVEDVKAEFGNDIVGLSNPVKTGDTFEKNGETYTILIYGDVNCDGKVTTADALMIRKHELNLIPLSTDIQKLAANVADGEDSKPVQQFILRLGITPTGTILDAYPIEFTANDIEVTLKNSTALRGERTLIANVSSKNDGILTSDLFNITAPENVILTYENKDDGSVDIYATSNVYVTSASGVTFEIIPVLSGRKLQNGRIEKDRQVITVKDVTSVTTIALYDENGKEVTDTLRIEPGTTANLTITYYHTYKDGSKVPLTESNIMLDKNVVKLELPSNTILDKTKTGFLANHTLSGEGFINSIQLASSSTTTGNEDIKIKINNDINLTNTFGYIGTFEKTIKLDINYPIVTGIELGAPKTGDSYDVTLYNTPQSGNNVKEVHPNEGTSTYATIVDLDLITDRPANNTKFPATLFSIGKSDDTMNDINTFVVCENSNPDENIGLYLAYFKKSGNDYTEITDHSDDFDAIGFASYDSTNYNGDIEYLEEGLTIYFGGTTDATGKVTKNSITINIHNGEKTEIVEDENPDSNVITPGEEQPIVDQLDSIQQNESNTNSLNTVLPSVEPTTTPSATPTTEPTTTPSAEPTTEPTITPSAEPTTTPAPTPTNPIIDIDEVPGSDHHAEPSIDDSL